jgi:hypothetical protein
MIALLSLLSVLVISIVVVRVATVALTLTGLSQELARFQARSALTGAGFTTSESENVVSHPVRRRIIMTLMVLGNAGIITVVSSLILSFVNRDPTRGLSGALWFRILILIVGLSVLWWIAHSRWIDRWMSRWITRALKRWTDLEIRDYAGLLRLAGEYAVVELEIESGDWLAEESLQALRLADEGVLVLGIERPDGVYIGAPRGESRLVPRDRILLYGRQDVLDDLDRRRAGEEGDIAHRKAVDEQRRISTKQRTTEEGTDSIIR